MQTIKVTVVDLYRADRKVALVDDEKQANFLIEVTDERQAEIKVAFVESYLADYKVAVVDNGHQQYSHFQSLLSMAKTGNIGAQFDVALCYEEGNGVQQNKAEAFRWFKEAAMKGHARAQNAVGVCYELGEGVPQNIGEARRWYQQSADNGCTKAMVHLAELYMEDGKKKKANKLFEKAAASGDEDAKAILKKL